MFNLIEYVSYDDDNECNTYNLYDSCFMEHITSPYGSPSLKYDKHKSSNTITLLSIMKFYERKGRNVSLNIASYYNWLVRECGYNVNRDLIMQQFMLLDDGLKTKLYKNNYHAVMFYLKNKFYFRM